MVLLGPKASLNCLCEEFGRAMATVTWILVHQCVCAHLSSVDLFDFVSYLINAEAMAQSSLCSRPCRM